MGRGRNSMQVRMKSEGRGEVKRRLWKQKGADIRVRAVYMGKGAEW